MTAALTLTEQDHVYFNQYKHICQRCRKQPEHNELQLAKEPAKAFERFPDRQHGG